MKWLKPEQELPRLKTEYAGSHHVPVLAVEKESGFIPMYFLFHPVAADANMLWWNDRIKAWVLNDKILVWQYLPSYDYKSDELVDEDELPVPFETHMAHINKLGGYLSDLKNENESIKSEIQAQKKVSFNQYKNMDTLHSEMNELKADVLYWQMEARAKAKLLRELTVDEVRQDDFKVLNKHVTREILIKENTGHLKYAYDQSEVNENDGRLLCALDNNARQFGEWLHAHCIPLQKGRWKFAHLNEFGKEVELSRGTAYTYYLKSLI